MVVPVPVLVVELGQGPEDWLVRQCVDYVPTVSVVMIMVGVLFRFLLPQEPAPMCFVELLASFLLRSFEQVVCGEGAKRDISTLGLVHQSLLLCLYGLFRRSRHVSRDIGARCALYEDSKSDLWSVSDWVTVPNRCLGMTLLAIFEWLDFLVACCPGCT